MQLQARLNDVVGQATVQIGGTAIAQPGARWGKTLVLQLAIPRYDDYEKTIFTFARHKNNK